MQAVLSGRVTQWLRFIAHSRAARVTICVSTAYNQDGIKHY